MNRWEKAKEKPEPVLRIVTQYWHGRVRVCELEKAGAKLDLRISRTADAEGWRVEATGGHHDSAPSFSECAPTRAGALSAVASSWLARGPALGLPFFDWDAVAIALRSVQAVE